MTKWDSGSEVNNDEELASWHAEGGSWSLDQGMQAHGYVRQESGNAGRFYLTSVDSVPAQIRAEADLRFLALETTGRWVSS